MEVSYNVQYGVPKPIYVGSNKQQFSSQSFSNSKPQQIYNQVKTSPLSTSTKSLNNLNKYHYKTKTSTPSLVQITSSPIVISTSHSSSNNLENNTDNFPAPPFSDISGTRFKGEQLFFDIAIIPWNLVVQKLDTIYTIVIVCFQMIMVSPKHP